MEEKMSTRQPDVFGGALLVMILLLVVGGWIITYDLRHTQDRVERLEAASAAEPTTIQKSTGWPGARDERVVVVRDGAWIVLEVRHGGMRVGELLRFDPVAQQARWSSAPVPNWQMGGK
jgi:hypothetical protein